MSTERFNPLDFTITANVLFPFACLRHRLPEVSPTGSHEDCHQYHPHHEPSRHQTQSNQPGFHRNFSSNTLFPPCTTFALFDGTITGCKLPCSLSFLNYFRCAQLHGRFASGAQACSWHGWESCGTVAASNGESKRDEGVNWVPQPSDRRVVRNQRRQDRQRSVLQSRGVRER